MIGWRPYLFTMLAVALVVAALLDIDAATQTPNPCATGDALTANGFPGDARQKLESVLAGDPSAACVSAGLAKVAVRQCLRAHKVSAVDPVQGRQQLVAAVTDDPALNPTKCAVPAAPKRARKRK
jgi:hypothetical protein